jgi:uncharacterized protein YbaR (Trm112 family)
MKKQLLELIICPHCLPLEHSLVADIIQEQGQAVRADDQLKKLLLHSAPLRMRRKRAGEETAPRDN